MDILEEQNIVISAAGLFHTVFALIAMICGLLVVFKKKGTKTHKILGYIYIVSMLLLNLSAFTIYNFGSFSIFHFFALVSLFTIISGVVPTLKRDTNWLIRHFSRMSWSVVGLYCAFWAEVGTRLFDIKFFWWGVLIATFTTSILGAHIIKTEREKMLSKKD